MLSTYCMRNSAGPCIAITPTMTLRASQVPLLQVRRRKLWAVCASCPRSRLARRGSGGRRMRTRSRVRSPLGIRRRLQPREPQAGLSSPPAPDKGRASSAPRGAAGWHFAVGFLQPWAAATELVPVLPQASFGNFSEACAPAAARRLSTPVSPRASTLCPKCHSPVQEEDRGPRDPFKAAQG